MSAAEARRDLPARHGFWRWRELRRHVEAMQTGEEPPTPFVLAYHAVEAGGRDRLVELIDRFPDLVGQRGTNGNDLLGMADNLEIVAFLLERRVNPNRGNDYGWTKLHQAGYSNNCDLARMMLDAGSRTDSFARVDGGTPLIAALFWGHREVAQLLGRQPVNLCVAAGLGDLELIRELASTPQAGAHRGFYRPHGGFPPGNLPRTRSRCSTRRSSGRRSPIASRRFDSSSNSAPDSTPTRTAAPRSPGQQ